MQSKNWLNFPENEIFADLFNKVEVIDELFKSFSEIFFVQEIFLPFNLLHRISIMEKLIVTDHTNKLTDWIYDKSR